jgi:hypothetical protein
VAEPLPSPPWDGEWVRVERDLDPHALSVTFWDGHCQRLAFRGHPGAARQMARHLRALVRAVRLTGRKGVRV